MNYSHDKMDELKNLIDQLTLNIMGSLETSDLEEITSLLAKREDALKELIAIADNEIKKGNILKNYLVDLHQRDKVIIQTILKEKEPTLHSNE